MWCSPTQNKCTVYAPRHYNLGGYCWRNWILVFLSIVFWSAHVHSWGQHLLCIQTINLKALCECRVPFVHFWIFETSSKVSICLAWHYIVIVDSRGVNRQIHTGCLWTIFLLALETLLETVGERNWILSSLLLIKRILNDCLRDLNSLTIWLL